jgi:hypothetical protein
MSKRELSRLKRDLQKVGVTQRRVAKAAKVHTSHVCNVLAGREISAPVVAAAQRLLAERQQELDSLLAKRQRQVATIEAAL